MHACIILHVQLGYASTGHTRKDLSRDLTVALSAGVSSYRTTELLYEQPARLCFHQETGKGK